MGFSKTEPTAPKTSITPYKDRSSTDKLFLAFSIVLITTIFFAIYFPALQIAEWKFDKPSRVIFPHDSNGKRCPVAVQWNRGNDIPHLRSNWHSKSCVNNCGRQEENHGGYCVPKIEDEKRKQGELYHKSKENFHKFQSSTACGMRDIVAAIKVIAASVGITICIIFVFMLSVHYMITPLVYGSILSVVIALGGLSIAFGQRTTILPTHDREARNWRYFMIVCSILIGILDVIFMAIMYKMRNQIEISIGIIESSIRVFEDVKTLLLFPFFSILVQLFFIIVWVYLALYLFATSDNKEVYKFPKVKGTFKVLDYGKTATTTFLPHLFVFFWIGCFIHYCSFCIMSGSIADWYFTPRHHKNDRKLRCSKKSSVYDDSVHLSLTPIIDSMFRTFRYHIGTILFAAMVVSIVRFFRFIVWYLIKIMDGGQQPNGAQIACNGAVECLLKLLNTVLDKVSKNALIYNAIFGDAFCPAIDGSFQLIWSNLVRAAHISMMTRMVMRLGKAMIVLVTVSICAIILFQEPYHKLLSSPVYPLIVIGILSFIICKVVLSVYVTAIDTVFVCFIIDEKCNRGGGHMLADKELLEVIAGNEENSKQAVKDNVAISSKADLF